MKRNKYIYIVFVSILLIGCSSIENNKKEQVVIKNNKNVLIAYFTRLDNTETEDIGDIFAGGGPYGSIDSSDIDSLSSASIQTDHDKYLGNTERVANTINNFVNGTTFSIQTKNKYPVNYDELIDQGNRENAQNIRPELISQVKNMETYDIVFLGFPDWYYDCPMAICSFIESYDFKNKIIIPFCTSAGSGFARSLDTIKSLLPENTTVLEGLAIDMKEVDDCENKIINWLNNLNF